MFLKRELIKLVESGGNPQSPGERARARGWGHYLWHEHQAEGDGAAEDDDQRHDAELHIGLVPGQEGNGRPDDAHYAHIVDAHPDVFAVIECRDADIACLPS